MKFAETHAKMLARFVQKTNLSQHFATKLSEVADSLGGFTKVSGKSKGKA